MTSQGCAQGAMPPPASPLALGEALARHGLRLRGAWVPTALDALPMLPGGRVAGVVWMVGSVGSECWDSFAASPMFTDGQPHPMDRWSRSIGNALARPLSGIALFPSDGPPYRPFAQWAARAEPLRTSPLKLQIHPRYGLWHAWRFALALPEADAGAAPGASGSAAAFDTDWCRNCDGQPCLGACPVQAFGVAGYDVARCASHLHAPQGTTCLSIGCLARRACPVAAELRYVAPHAAFHMAAFAGNHPCPNPPFARSAPTPPDNDEASGAGP